MTVLHTLVVATLLTLAYCAVPLSQISRQADATPVPLPRPVNSSCPINSVCFAIDRSGSISADEYAIAQQFVVGISRQIARRTLDTLYSAYGFSSAAQPIQTDTRNLTRFIQSVEASINVGGGTNIAAGLGACRDQVLDNPGNRVIVLITDGQGSDNGVAAEINAAGIALVTVGVGNGIDADFLRSIATRPRFFITSTFDTLPSEVVRVAETSCSVANMMPMRPTAAPTTTTTTAAPTRSGCQRAFDGCDFRFEGSRSLRTFEIGVQADVNFTKRIVSKRPNERLGVLNTNEVIPEFIQRDGSARNITLFGNPRLTPTHFKPFYVMPRKVGMAGGSGIGHQTFTGDQLSVSRRRCVRVFFTQFQLLNSAGHVISNEHVSKSANKCVVFWTR